LFVTYPGNLVTAVIENDPLPESTGEEAGNASTTGMSMDKFLVFVMKVMVVFVPLINKVTNSGPGVKTNLRFSHIN
jgi:hypothetical protein